MTRNLKTLGLALGTVFALGAVLASTASAVTQPVAHFTASEYPAHITGTQIENHTFAVFPGNITCEAAHFESHAQEKASTSLTVTPKYENCTTQVGGGAKKPTTVTTNGCWYRFTVHEKGTTHEEKTLNTPGIFGGNSVQAISHTWTGDFHLECPVGVNGIEVHVYENATKHANNESQCTYTIKPQTINNLHIVIHTVAGEPARATVYTENSEVKVNRTSGGLFSCGAAEQTAKYNGNTTVETTNSSGTRITGSIDTVTT
jgi:hypothetical protein